MVDLEAFVQERNAALFSFDEQRIMEYSRKYQIAMPNDKRTFWKAICISILNIPSAPESIKAEARARLAALGGGNGAIN